MQKSPPSASARTRHPNHGFILSTTPTSAPTDRHFTCVASRTALKTENLSSKVSNKQAAFLRAGASSGTVWQFQKATHGKDGRVDRILGVGSPVCVDTEVGCLVPSALLFTKVCCNCRCLSLLSSQASAALLVVLLLWLVGVVEMEGCCCSYHVNLLYDSSKTRGAKVIRTRLFITPRDCKSNQTGTLQRNLVRRALAPSYNSTSSYHLNLTI